MERMKHLLECLEPQISEAVRRCESTVTDIRIRCGTSTTIRLMDGSGISFPAMNREDYDRMIVRLMNHSVYAHDEDRSRGFFTAAGGFRVGICAGSLCIRFAREIIGCSDRIFKAAFGSGLHSMLIISPPGMGKTTILRDIARNLSESGHQIGIADERHELCSCLQGIPTLNIGTNTDVIDGIKKSEAIGMLVRTMAPEVIIADEIGDKNDCDAILDALRCGVYMVATIHGSDVQAAADRPFAVDLLTNGAFDFAVVLGPTAGSVTCMRDLKKGVNICF